jgi:hypothetical protein
MKEALYTAPVLHYLRPGEKYIIIIIITTQINGVIYWIQWHSRAKMMVAHLDRLVQYPGGYSGPVAWRRKQCHGEQQRLTLRQPAKPLMSQLPLC